MCTYMAISEFLDTGEISLVELHLLERNTRLKNIQSVLSKTFEDMKTFIKEEILLEK